MKTPQLHFFTDALACRQRQQGVAAIEFSLLAILMAIVLLGLMVWWQYFQASQILTRAAGDGARAAHTLVMAGTAPCLVPNAAANQEKIESRVEQIIQSQLTFSGLSSSSATISNKSWKCSSTGTESFSFDISYQLHSLIGNNDLMTGPARLKITDNIIVHFPSKT